MRKAFLLSIVALATMTGTANAHMLTHSSGASWSGQTWHIASGRNGAGQMNCPSHVHFGSAVTIIVSGMCGGGIGGSFAGGVGASWSVTFSDTRGGGKYAIGLWPVGGARGGPEVDFAEDKPTDSGRVLMTGTYHPHAGSCNGCIHSKITGDFTKTHTATVRHTSSGYVLSLDGRVWATYPSGFGGQQRLFIHNEAWGSSGSSTLTISKVSVG